MSTRRRSRTTIAILVPGEWRRQASRAAGKILSGCRNLRSVSASGSEHAAVPACIAAQGPGTVIALAKVKGARMYLRREEDTMFENRSLSRREREPRNRLRQMSAELDYLLDEPWTLFRWASPDVAVPEAPLWAPRVDVVTKDNALVTRVDLPGMKKDDVLVEVQDGYLTFSGERKNETKEEKSNVYREEREYGNFCRRLPLPQGVKAEDVRATFTNGVLEITIPLPAVTPPGARKIPVHDAASTAKTESVPS